MNKRTQDAYRIVLTDILNRDISLFVGRYDAKNGNKHFMYGIRTVMEFIANTASEESLEEFETIWDMNSEQSEQKGE